MNLTTKGRMVKDNIVNAYMILLVESKLMYPLIGKAGYTPLSTYLKFRNLYVILFRRLFFFPDSNFYENSASENIYFYLYIFDTSKDMTALCFV